MVFRREVIDEIGGFDADFGAGTLFCCEDCDAFERASFAGWWGMYSPDPVVAHHHGRKAADIRALKRSYGRGNGAYLAKFTMRPDTSKLFAEVWFHRVTHCGTFGVRTVTYELAGAGLYILHQLALRVRHSWSDWRRSISLFNSADTPQ